MILNISKPHPQDKSRSLIYWDAGLILLPAQLGGSAVAVIFTHALPETPMLIAAIVILLIAIFKTTLKGIHTYKAETASINELREMLLSTSDVDSEEFSNDIETEESKLAGWKGYSDSVDEVPIRFPSKIISILFGLWTIVVSISLIMEYATEKCTSLYFSLSFLSFPFLIGSVIWGLSYVSKLQIADPSVILHGDLNFQNVSYIPSVLAFIIGILCALLGIGGGELMGPLLLSLHVLPQVSTATTSMMSMFNTTANVLHYGIMGEIPSMWGAIVFVIGFFGGFVGRKSALIIAQKYHRSSITVFMLATVLIISVALLFEHIFTKDIDFDLHGFC